MSADATVGRVFNIQKFSVHDGPGIRTLVFFKGCPLRCAWCANPEGLELRPALMFKQKECTACGRCVAACPHGVHTLVPGDAGPRHELARDRCQACGTCADACWNEALRLLGTERTLDDVLRVVLDDRVFYTASGGGVTLGGGDPLMQPAFARALLERCKGEGIHTAVETAAHGHWEVIESLLPFVDLFLVDLKHVESKRHEAATGQPNDLILANLARLLALGAPMMVRVPIIPGFNDTLEDIDAIGRFLEEHDVRRSLLGVELLSYHQWGTGKYRELDLPYTAPERRVDEAFLPEAKRVLESHSLETNIEGGTAT